MQMIVTSSPCSRPAPLIPFLVTLLPLVLFPRSSRNPTTLHRVQASTLVKANLGVGALNVKVFHQVGNIIVILVRSLTTSSRPLVALLDGLV